jgi:hypothetical protein
LLSAELRTVRISKRGTGRHVRLQSILCPLESIAETALAKTVENAPST